jgi:hypothetical protein
MKIGNVLTGWLLVAALSVASAQTKVDLRTQSKSADFSAASPTKPVTIGTPLPATCSAGQMFYLTTATAGANLYSCTATNVWTQEGSVTNAGGALTADLPLFGAGGNDAKPVTKTGSGNQVVVSQSPTIVSPAVADFTNMPHTHVNTAGGGQLGIAAMLAGSLSGNGTKLGTVTGALTPGDCTKFDASGNLVDSGILCGQANFRQSFTNVTSVTLTHNFNSFAIVFACFDNGAPPLWILPKSAGLTNANTLTVTFASLQTGSCVVNASGGGSNFVPGTGINFAGSNIAVDGTFIPKYLTASASLSFGAIAQAACAQLTLALTGAATGDSIAPGWPATLENGFTGSMFVSANNTVAVRLCNLSGATLTPAAQSFRATVLKGF